MRFLQDLPIDPGFLLAAGIAVLAFVLLRRTMKNYRRARAVKPIESPVDRQRSATPLLDAPHEALRWEVEMHETARDLKAELDSKISALQTLLLLAAEERRRLEAVLDRCERQSTSGSGLAGSLGVRDAGRSARSESLLPGNEQQRSEIYALSDQGIAPQEIATHLAVPVGEVEFLLGLRSRC